MNLYDAAQLAVIELDRIDRFEFEPERFAERRKALDELCRAVHEADREEAVLEANTIAQYETTEFPDWMGEASQLFLEELSSLSQDEEARLLPEGSVAFFI